MDDILRIKAKYTPVFVREGLGSAEKINKFALIFYKDVAEIYEFITRVRNPQRNPTGFSLEDAPILGLLVRVWKLLKEVISFYEHDKAEIICILDRPLLEAAVVAMYLMTNETSVIADYRKCSYKSRLRILRDIQSGSSFSDTKAGKRLRKSVEEKLNREGLKIDDFDVQRENKWKIQGKSFYDIFAEVVHEDFYASSYGMMSESIHGSWNESMDFCLVRNDDATFSCCPFYQPADIRYVTPVLKHTIKPFQLWLQRIDVNDADLSCTLEWVDRVNHALYRNFDREDDG